MSMHERNKKCVKSVKFKKNWWHKLQQNLFFKILVNRQVLAEENLKITLKEGEIIELI